jgi:hypothetical protein
VVVFWICFILALTSHYLIKQTRHNKPTFDFRSLFSLFVIAAKISVGYGIEGSTR